MIKVYHWSTLLYARHVATCTFVTNADAIIDKIIETYSSRYGRPSPTHKYSMTVQGLTDAGASAVMRGLASWLTNEMPKFLKPKDTDLMNLRDELLNEVHQALYMFDLH